MSRISTPNAANDSPAPQTEAVAPDNADELELAIWHDPALQQALQQLNDNDLSATVVSQPASPFWRHWPALAACLVLLACGWLFFRQPQLVAQLEAAQLLSYHSEVGQPQVVNLQDGSEVSMNADTQLSVSFSGQRRNVSLKQGEAYFDVQQDRQRPFVIGTQWGDIQVVGTEFNVDQTADGVEVSVYEGQVLVTSLQGDSTMLRVGERARLSGDSIEVSAFDATAANDWMTGQLVVDGHSIQYVVEQLNRYSEQPVYLAPDVGPLHISGAFELQNMSQSLALLAGLSGLQLSDMQGIYYLAPLQ